MDTEFIEHRLGVSQHIHQMRNRRSLIAADIADARLEQGLGERQNAFAAELLAGAQLEIFDFARERPFSHHSLPRKTPILAKSYLFAWSSVNRIRPLFTSKEANRGHLRLARNKADL